MARRSVRSVLRSTVHVVSYGTWLVGQIIKESLIMAKDTFTTGRNIAPVILYYPLRVTDERDVAAFIASITMTPGTLALGVTGPKEVDADAESGKFNPRDIGATGPKEFRTHGLPRVQRFLAVHAMYGSDPQELLHGLAVMEAKIAPEVKQKSPEFDVEHLVERGVPGPRGYRGTHGGRASEDSVFAVEKVDSTPHANAFVAAIMRAEDELDVADLPDLSKAEREKIAREHAEKMSAQRKAEQKQRFLARIEQPEKNWKFEQADINERRYWDDYQRAYQAAIRATSTKANPWYIIPADDKWTSRLIVARIMVERLKQLKLAFPVTAADQEKMMKAAMASLAKEKD